MMILMMIMMFAGLAPGQGVALLRVLVPGPGAPGLADPRQVAAERRDQEARHLRLDQPAARGRPRPLPAPRSLRPGEC